VSVDRTLVDALAALPGVVAIALGGSRAAGTARPDSDTDIALYYREADPPQREAIRAAASRVDPAAAPTDFYGWGPWVNGGAWLHTAGGRVDLIYRNLDQVDRVLSEAAAGRVEWDFHQQPATGFHNVIYLAETAICVPLHDPHGVLATLKTRVREYPPALRDAIISVHGWGGEFSLYHARGAAARGDVYNTVGGLMRTAGHLTQVLFALNRVYFLSDKGALEAIDRFALAPPDYAPRVRALLAAPGADAAALTVSLDAMTALLHATLALAGDSYRPPFRLP
jgi:hypothetical protein